MLASVAGKAIYSYRSFEEAEALLADGDFDVGPDELAAELRTLRDQRLVVEQEDSTLGGYSAGALEGHRHVPGHDDPYRNLHSAAVPIRTPDDYGIAALEVTGPAAGLSGRRLEEAVASFLVAAGKSVETNLVQGW